MHAPPLPRPVRHCASVTRGGRLFASQPAGSASCATPHSGYHADGESRRWFEGWCVLFPA
jgi:hypothetical protein